MTLQPEAGIYRNTTTGVEFRVTLDGDDAVIHDGLRSRELTRRDAINFGFNVEIGTYDLVAQSAIVRIPTEG